MRSHAALVQGVGASTALMNDSTAPLEILASAAETPFKIALSTTVTKTSLGSRAVGS